MKQSILSLILCVLGVVTYAQQNHEITYWGVIATPNETMLEGKLTIDFEQQLVSVQQEGNNITQQVPFQGVHRLWFYDHLKQVRREFVKHQQTMYEVVLQGEVSLLRKYAHNTSFNTHVQDTQYYLSTEQQNIISVGALEHHLQDVFQDNVHLIKKMIQTKHYELKDIQHIATLVRYHNQCRAKMIAQR